MDGTVRDEQAPLPLPPLPLPLLSSLQTGADRRAVVPCFSGALCRARPGHSATSRHVPPRPATSRHAPPRPTAWRTASRSIVHVEALACNNDGIIPLGVRPASMPLQATRLRCCSGRAGQSRAGQGRGGQRREVPHSSQDNEAGRAGAGLAGYPMPPIRWQVASGRRTSV